MICNILFKSIIFGNIKYFLSFICISQFVFADGDKYDAKCYKRKGVFVLDYSGEKFDGYTKINLKDVFHQVCSEHKSLAQFKLSSVIVLAKAKDEGALLRLSVGSYKTVFQRLNDNYEPITLKAPFQSRPYASWFLHFRKKVKVDRIVVNMTPIHKVPKRSRTISHNIKVIKKAQPKIFFGTKKVLNKVKRRNLRQSRRVQRHLRKTLRKINRAKIRANKRANRVYRKHHKA